MRLLAKNESTWENPDPKRRISRKTTVKYPETCNLSATMHFLYSTCNLSATLRLLSR